MRKPSLLQTTLSYQVLTRPPSILLLLCPSLYSLLSAPLASLPQYLNDPSRSFWNFPMLQMQDQTRPLHLSQLYQSCILLRLLQKCPLHIEVFIPFHNPDEFSKPQNHKSKLKEQSSPRIAPIIKPKLNQTIKNLTKTWPNRVPT